MIGCRIFKLDLLILDCIICLDIALSFRYSKSFNMNFVGDYSITKEEVVYVVDIQNESAILLHIGEMKR